MSQAIRKFAVAAVLTAAAAWQAAAATTTWKIDPAHTAAQFAVKHLMISTVRGEFKAVTGTVTWDDQDVTKSKVDVTIHGVTKEVVLEVEGPTAPVKDPWGNTRVAASATTKVNRQDYGVKWNANMDGGGVVVGDTVNI